MTTFDKEYGQDFKITVSQDDQDIKIAHGHNAAIIRHVKTLNMWDVSTWIDSAKTWVESPDLPTIFEAFDLAKKSLLVIADDDIGRAKQAMEQAMESLLGEWHQNEEEVMMQDTDAVVIFYQAPAQPLSDRLETIREEALCAIEEVAEKGTIELLSEDIFDADSCWIKRITKIDHPAFKNSTSKLRDQLHLEVFSGDEDDHYFNYESDLLTLKTDTLVQIADFLAKN